MRRATSQGDALLPQLDSLRGVAVLCVLAQHLGDGFMPAIEAGVTDAAPSWLAPWVLTAIHHAWWGVDLFFVLSGFALALGLTRAFARGRPPAAAAFLRRRAARILPAFWVALAITIAAHGAVVGEPGFPRALALHALLLQGYAGPESPVFIGASWSLTTEAGFYLLLPLVAAPMLSPDRSWRRRALLVAALCLGAWATRGLLHAAVLEPGARTWLLELTQRRLVTSRLDAFVLGAAAASAHLAIERSRHAAIARTAAPLVLLLAALGLVGAFRLEGALFLTPGGSWPGALMSLATALLVLAAAQWSAPFQAGRLMAPLRWAGLVSYGVFLYHQLAIGVAGAWIAGEATLSRMVAVGALALALSLAAGAASYFWVELRFLGGPRPPRRPRASTAA